VLAKLFGKQEKAKQEKTKQVGIVNITLFNLVSKYYKS